MAVSVNLAKALDKAYEDLTLTEILDAPVDALAGLTPKHAELFAELKIKTIRDLGTNKYVTVAQELAALEEYAG